MKLRHFYVAWLLWVLFGIHAHFLSDPASQATLNIGDLKPSQKGSAQIFKGTLYTGYEDGVLFPTGTVTVEQSAKAQGAAVDFRGLNAMFNLIRSQGNGVVSGVLDYKWAGGFGHMGMYEYKITQVKVLRWPPLIERVSFALNCLLLPAILATCIHITRRVRRGRAPKLSRRAATGE